MKATLKQIAKELGVSVSTVSKSLSDSPEISEPTKIRIQEYAKLHNYKPNSIAKNLKSRKSYTIGVIVPNILNPFFAKVFTGIEKVAQQKGYNVITVISNESTEKEKYLIDKKHSFFEAIPLAAKECYMQFTYSIKQLKLLIKPKTEAWKHIKSPIGITDKLIPSTWDWEYFWNFTAMFSIGLAFMNLLPIPGLDGAHALFTIAEMITGRTLSDKAMGVVQTVGMVILLSLMAFTFGKDIYDIILENIR